jgi:hypothetical protein
LFVFLLSFSNAFSSYEEFFRPLDTLPKKTRLLMNRGHSRSQEIRDYNENGQYPISEIKRIYEGFSKTIEDEIFKDKLEEVYQEFAEKLFVKKEAIPLFLFRYRERVP